MSVLIYEKNYFKSVGLKLSKMGTTKFVLTIPFQSSVPKQFFLKSLLTMMKMMMIMEKLKLKRKMMFGEILIRHFMLV